MEAPPLQRLIGTFHKSGTVLFEGILRDAASMNLVTPWFMEVDAQPAQWDVAFAYHSERLYPMVQAASSDNVRCVICVRDPRDVVVSATFYHQTSDERWLHKKRREFGGLTYQEKINALPDVQARFLFEMGEASKRTIDNMRRIPKDTNAIHVTRLETLVGDGRDEEYRRIFEFLGFDGDRLAALLNIADRNSITPRKTEPGAVATTSQHVRSGRPRQFITEFSAKTLEMFNAMHGNIAAELGYPD